MHIVYLLSVSIHVLAATVWIGGMLFLTLVVVPWLRGGDRARAAALLEATGLRFRRITWTAFAILVATGAVNLSIHGVRLGDFADPEWRAAPFGRTLCEKLVVFAAVAVLGAVHDFVVGPRATAAAQLDPDSPRARRLRAAASWMGRTSLLLGLVILALAVSLVRGSW